MFATALRLAASEDPGAAAEVVRSRAAVLSWRSAAGLEFQQAERTRIEVFAAFLEQRGLEPLRAGLRPAYSADGLGDGNPGELRVPRGRALEGDRIRRGGSR